MGIIETLKRLNKQKNILKDNPQEFKDTVRVIDIDGSELDVPVFQSIDSNDRVLIADGGKTYHTHLSCFKNWTGDAQRNFTGWKIIDKSEAINKGMTYCKFCDEDDNMTLDDLLGELDDILADVEEDDTEL